MLGHHREDILETFLLNLFHGGTLAAMPPKLLNDEGDLLVLRPLAARAEADSRGSPTRWRFPIIPCDLCGSQDGLQRGAIKAMLDDWERARPGTKRNMLRALANSRPSHLLDPKLFDFCRARPGSRRGGGLRRRRARCGRRAFRPSAISHHAAARERQHEHRRA